MSVFSLYIIIGAIFIIAGLAINHFAPKIISHFSLAILTILFFSFSGLFVDFSKKARNSAVYNEIGQVKVELNPSDQMAIVKYNDKLIPLHEACYLQFGMDGNKKMIGKTIDVYEKKYLPVFGYDSWLSFVKYKTQPDITFYYGTNPMMNKPINLN